jgi:hypothetical protein
MKARKGFDGITGQDDTGKIYTFYTNKPTSAPEYLLKKYRRILEKYDEKETVKFIPKETKEEIIEFNPFDEKKDKKDKKKEGDL